MIIDKSMAPIMTIQQHRPIIRILKKIILSKSLGFGVSGFEVPGFGVSDMI